MTLPVASPSVTKGCSIKHIYKGERGPDVLNSGVYRTNLTRRSNRRHAATTAVARFVPLQPFFHAGFVHELSTTQSCDIGLVIKANRAGFGCDGFFLKAVHDRGLLGL